MANIVTERGGLDSFDPRRVPPSEIDIYDYEEAYPQIPKSPETAEQKTFYAIRCLTTFVCLVSIILVLVNIARGNRLKSWRLYFLVALSIFSWIALTLYQDIIDEYHVQHVTVYPQPRSIYQCFRNFIHGFSLYMILLLLAHLSDMQHKSHWFGFISAVILIPLIYSVGLLITDLRLDPNDRKKEYVNTAIESARVLLYNIVTTVLLFVMSRSFCTSRLYGTYSEKRSKVVVVVARWTFAMLFLHNMVSIAHYAIKVVLRHDPEVNLSQFTLISNILHEVSLFIIVLAVPISYLMGALAQCCCGLARGNEMEMDRVDKIYTDVWTTPSLRTPASRPSSATAQTSMTSETAPSGPPPSTGLQNGVVARRNHGSNSTLSSVDSIGELPRIGTNPAGGARNDDRRKRVRASYMEAVSTGSLNDDRSSVTSDPIDL